jgi:hypothetical protein
MEIDCHEAELTQQTRHAAASKIKEHEEIFRIAACL